MFSIHSGCSLRYFNHGSLLGPLQQRQRRRSWWLKRQEKLAGYPPSLRVHPSPHPHVPPSESFLVSPIGTSWKTLHPISRADFSTKFLQEKGRPFETGKMQVLEWTAFQAINQLNSIMYLQSPSSNCCCLPPDCWFVLAAPSLLITQALLLHFLQTFRCISKWVRYLYNLRVSNVSKSR